MKQTTKQKQTLRYRKKIYGCQGEEGWGKDEVGFGAPLIYMGRGYILFHVLYRTSFRVQGLGHPSTLTGDASLIEASQCLSALI